MLIFFYFLREKGIKTIETAEKHLAAFAPVICPAIELPALDAVSEAKIFKSSRGGIKPGYAFIGTQPEVSVVVFQYPVNDIVGQAMLAGIMGKGFFLPVELIEPAAAGSDPQITASVL